MVTERQWHSDCNSSFLANALELFVYRLFCSSVRVHPTSHYLPFYFQILSFLSRSQPATLIVCLYRSFSSFHPRLTCRLSLASYTLCVPTRRIINTITTPSAAAEPIASAPKNSLLTNLAELSKARLSALVVSTTACGFLAAGPIALSTPVLPTLAAASAGTALCAASAATLNQLFEIDRDKRMKRTAKRPLPSGNVTPNFARGRRWRRGVRVPPCSSRGRIPSPHCWVWVTWRCTFDHTRP